MIGICWGILGGSRGVMDVLAAPSETTAQTVSIQTFYIHFLHLQSIFIYIPNLTLIKNLIPSVRSYLSIIYLGENQF